MEIAIGIAIGLAIGAATGRKKQRPKTLAPPETAEERKRRQTDELISVVIPTVDNNK